MAVSSSRGRAAGQDIGTLGLGRQCISGRTGRFCEYGQPPQIGRIYLFIDWSIYLCMWICNFTSKFRLQESWARNRPIQFPRRWKVVRCLKNTATQKTNSSMVPPVLATFPTAKEGNWSGKNTTSLRECWTEHITRRRVAVHTCMCMGALFWQSCARAAWYVYKHMPVQMYSPCTNRRMYVPTFSSCTCICAFACACVMCVSMCGLYANRDAWLHTLLENMYEVCIQNLKERCFCTYVSIISV